MSAARIDIVPRPIDQDRIIVAFGELGTVAPVAMKVIEMADDEEVSLQQLVDVISTDPGLASRLLRLANSAAYSRGQPVTNLNRAAMLIGLRTLKLVTLGFSLIDTSKAAGQIDSSLLWRRSLATAVLARQMAMITAPELAEDAFAAGLLANVGKLALIGVPQYAEAVEQTGLWITAPDERYLLGCTTDELSARILDNWGLPGLMSEAVWSRHPENIDDVSTPVGALLRVADHASVLLLAEEGTDKARAYDAATLAAAHLGLTMHDIEDVVGASGPELADLTSTFELASISTAEIEDIIRSAQTSLARISFDMASQLSEERLRNDELVETNQELAAVASTDALTGLANRRTFDAFLANQLAQRRRQDRSSSLGIVLLDIDRFKAINDTHGHTVGDEVLAEFGRRLSEGCRKGELVARTGGEEFALVLPSVDAAGLLGAAERMRNLLDGNPVFTEAGSLLVTLSAGACLTDDTEPGVEKRLYEGADAALYESKRNGRNRVTVKTGV